MDSQLAKLARLRADFPFFAQECLKIRTKEGATAPLRLNEAQLQIHARLETQKAEKGWVRALILKGRQQGASTYVAARFYHRTTTVGGTNTYILAHEQPASDNLFGIVDRYQRHNPCNPHVGTSNVKELVFDRLDSSYVVATAGQKAGGRSRSVTLFHGSEVAFWANAADHFASSVQAVPLLPNTEIILESTANGPSGEFYQRWQDAMSGEGDYIAVFIPWFLSSEYVREPPSGFVLSDEAGEGEMSEVEYAASYGLSLPQMAWRRAKISELRSSELFRQEYPSNPTEAFVTAGHEPYIKALYVIRAQKRNLKGQGPLIIGVDPASMGGDRFAAAGRRGHTVEWVKTRRKIDEVTGANWIKSLIDEHDPARVNIDLGSMGHAIFTMVKLFGPKYAKVIRGVNFGGTSQAKIAQPRRPGPANRRAEMWQRCRDWLTDEVQCALPDKDSVLADLTAPKELPQVNGDFKLESKKDMRARGAKSTDEADAIVLTFAQLEHFANYSEPKAKRRFGDIDSPAQRDITEQAEVSGGAHSWMM